MTQLSVTAQENPAMSSKIEEITLDHPWQWIAKGWNDFTSAPVVSIAYGILFFISSIGLTMLVFSSDFFAFVPPLTASFFLIAPILAVGLYDNSRRLENNEPTGLVHAITTWRRNSFNLTVMGLILMMVLIIWMMVANLVFAVFFNGVSLTLDDLIPTLFLSGDSPAFLAVGMISGGIIALIVYSITVISIPMLIDSKANVLQAIATSVNAVIRNPRPLLLWASLIVMFVGIGLVTFYVAFLVCMPVIGYASWHAYRDLVADADDI